MWNARNIPIIISWVAFIGVLLYDAAQAPISDVYWINLVYITLLIGSGIAIWIGSVIMLAHNFPGKSVIVFGGATMLAFALLALDQYWIRDWLTARL